MEFNDLTNVIARDGFPSRARAIGRGMVVRILSLAFAVTVVTTFSTPALPAPFVQVALAEEEGTAASSFAYKHNPIYNPRAMEDVVENPDAVYGFSPNPNAGSLKQYATYDWTDPEVVAQARENRRVYLEQDQQIYDLVSQMEDEGSSTEEIARAASAKRNQIRLDAYKDDPEGLAKLKARNLEKYGYEDGPTPELLFEKYGSWEAVIDNAFNTNSGMDACCGFYDDNWEKYVHFGQIPIWKVTFDVAGHGQTPDAQDVYAGETAKRPDDPTERGWAFQGWFVKSDDAPFDFAMPVTNDITLVATWAKVIEPVPTPDKSEPGKSESETETGGNAQVSSEKVPADKASVDKAPTDEVRTDKAAITQDGGAGTKAETNKDARTGAIAQTANATNTPSTVSRQTSALPPTSDSSSSAPALLAVAVFLLCVAVRPRTAPDDRDR